MIHDFNIGLGMGGSFVQFSADRNLDEVAFNEVTADFFECLNCGLSLIVWPDTLQEAPINTGQVRGLEVNQRSVAQILMGQCPATYCLPRQGQHG